MWFSVPLQVKPTAVLVQWTVLVQMEYTVNQREEVMGCVWKKKIQPHDSEQVEVEKN